VKPAAGSVASGATWALSGAQNDAFTVVNRLLKAGASVSRKDDGTWIIANTATSKPVVEKAARELGLTFAAGTAAGANPVKAMRVGLWDRYGGSMPAGWTKWLLEQYEFQYSIVYPQELDAGNLNAKYDALVFVDGAIPAKRGNLAAPGRRGGGFGGGVVDTATLPAELRRTVGNVTEERTIPALRRFVENGGMLITIGRSKPLIELEKFNPDEAAAMPAAASENAPRKFFGIGLANRRCSEWRAAVGRIAAARKERRKACFGRMDDNSGRHGSEAFRREQSRRESRADGVQQSVGTARRTERIFGSGPTA
jgi:hypothetical protein